MRSLVPLVAARTLAAAVLASFAIFFWAVSVGGILAFADGEWVQGSGISFTVAVALATLLTCAGFAFAPIERGRRPSPAPFPILPTAGGAIGRKRPAARRTHP